MKILCDMCGFSKTCDFPAGGADDNGPLYGNHVCENGEMGTFRYGAIAGTKKEHETRHNKVLLHKTSRVSRAIDLLTNEISMASKVDEITVLSNCLHMLIAFEQAKFAQIIATAERAQKKSCRYK
jgi:hypothetical protein